MKTTLIFPDYYAYHVQLTNEYDIDKSLNSFQSLETYGAIQYLVNKWQSCRNSGIHPGIANGTTAYSPWGHTNQKKFVMSFGVDFRN